MRASTAGRTSRVRTKTHELAGIRALQRATEQLARRVSALCADVDRSADAAVVMGRVLEQWPQMFKVLALILEAQDALAERLDADALARNPVGETLVRFSVQDVPALP